VNDLLEALNDAIADAAAEDMAACKASIERAAAEWRNLAPEFDGHVPILVAASITTAGQAILLGYPPDVVRGRLYEALGWARQMAS
jgi:hypothetical protein